MKSQVTAILAIETSCDETSIALVEASGGIKKPRIVSLVNLVSSQIEIHRPFGGVVPNLAKREHLKNLPIVFNKIFGSRTSECGKSDFSKIDILAVTVGPGLEPCLWAGIEFAKKIHAEYFPKAKLMGVNHMEGHLYSFLLRTQKKTVNSKHEALNSKQKNFEFRISNFEFPAVGLVVSGGHTILLLMQSLTKWKRLGETRDDAVGEAFDKVARMLGLPYPGGPEIQKLANDGSPTAIDFPRPMMRTKDYDFSFSGLKTAVLYYLRDLRYSHWGIVNRGETKKNLNPIPKTLVANICASFQQAAVDVLVYKTMRAAREFGAKSVILAGGVAANKLLREELNVKCKMLNVNFVAPSAQFNTDNAAMIGASAYISHLKKQNRQLVARAGLSL